MAKLSLRQNLYRWAENKSLNEKLKIMITSVMVPFIALIIALIFIVSYFGISYGNIVSNVTLANRYNLQFEKKLDSVMYQMVARSLHKDEVEDVLGMEGPDALITSMQNSFETLEASAHSEKSRAVSQSIKKLLNTLKKRVDDINDTVTQSGSYDDNMQRLDSDIRIITELIQERITEYIYYETTSMEELQTEMNALRIRMMTITVFLTILISLIAAGYSYVIGESITKPVQNLCQAVEKVGQGEFDTQTEVAENNELYVLTDSFNLMTKRISNLIDNIKEEQQHSRDIELRLLQSQINPHFLYNTLDNIIWLAEDGQMEDIEFLVSSLSQFFRSTLAGGRDFVTLKEEIAHIEAYLEIQQYRYRDILKYQIIVPETLENCGIPKLTLQPLIENALYHGIKNKRGGGTITVTAKELPDNIVQITVADDGAGMTAAQLDELRALVEGTKQAGPDNKGFGISNIGERLFLTYGRRDCLHFESGLGKGTSAIVQIPIKQADRSS